MAGDYIVIHKSRCFACDMRRMFAKLARLGCIHGAMPGFCHLEYCPNHSPSARVKREKLEGLA